MTSEFVEDWICYDTSLGEGAYGEVKLLMHKTNKEKIACKIINHQRYKDAASVINREVIIHKTLDHENIIRFFGRRHEPMKEYIFLEYAAGGELFQQIEPDVGMPSSKCQRYMKELLCGVKYLHDRGIAHRDIKPENLLISGSGVLKISDFGLATLFRYRGKERLLDKKCGTKPYLAPEVLEMPYRAQPADLWSCGVVYVAMLTGELPWTEPSHKSEEFIAWKNEDYLSMSPWSKLGNTALSLAKQILTVIPKKRATLEQVQNHPWMKFIFKQSPSDYSAVDGTMAIRWNSVMEFETKLPHERPQVVLSQPETRNMHLSIFQAIKCIKTSSARGQNISFSQPIHNEDLMIQLAQSPVTKENFHDLVKRLTRFYVDVDVAEALDVLGQALDTLHYPWNVDVNGGISVSTVDLSKNQLQFKILPINIDEKILLDFRLSKGCGLQFKKVFLKIKERLVDVIDNNDC